MRILQGLFVSIFFFSLTSHATNVEYIEVTQASRLNIEFDKAQPLSKEAMRLLNASRWQCDMYGMSSRMQVERNVKLYAFAEDAASQFKNSGAQVIKTYKKDRDFQGVNGSLRDSLRLTSSGELISKLEILSPENQSARVLAISQCTRI